MARGGTPVLRYRQVFSPRIDGDAIEDIAYDYFLLFVYNFFVFLINRSAEIVVYAATEARYIYFFHFLN